MILSIILTQKKVNVEINQDNMTHPIRMWSEDMSGMMPKETARQLGQELLNAVQELDRKDNING